MKWFKHMTDATVGEGTSDLLDEFGPEGYGVWWLILEAIARLMDNSERTHAKYPLRKWTETCHVSSRKLKKIVEFLQNKGNITAEYEGKYLIIDCPQLALIRDEYSRKQKQDSSKNRDNVRSLSRQCPSQEVDTDTEKEKEVEKEILSASFTERKILKALKEVPAYPFDPVTDLAYIREWMVDYPYVDLLDEVDSWKTYLSGVKKQPKNKRLAFRNWLKKANQWAVEKGAGSERYKMSEKERREADKQKVEASFSTLYSYFTDNPARAPDSERVKEYFTAYSKEYLGRSQEGRRHLFSLMKKEFAEDRSADFMDTLEKCVKEACQVGGA